MLAEANILLPDNYSHSYSYNYENRLVRIQKGAGTVAEYAYDALGRRIKAGGKSYYYDGGWRVLFEQGPSGENQNPKCYVYGNYLDEVLLVRDIWGQTDYYYAHDHLYSPVALMNGSGGILERYEYDAYGRRHVFDDAFVARSGSANPIAFTGQRVDVLDGGDLELMYYKNRYYDGEMGRFLTRDPIGYADGMNLYQYVQSSPVMSMDVIGHRTETKVRSNNDPRYGKKEPGGVKKPYDTKQCMVMMMQGCENRKKPAPDNPVIPIHEWGHHPDPTPLPGYEAPIPAAPSRGNCYRYACNDPKKPGEPHNGMPGKRGYNGGEFKCDNVRAGALDHGLKEPSNKTGACPSGTTRVAFAVTKKPYAYFDNQFGRIPLHDCHWYREVEPGKWCHKPGQTDVTCVDAAGNAIKDPESCNRDYSSSSGLNYDEFCGFLCAPNNMDVDAPPASGPNPPPLALPIPPKPKPNP